MKSTFEEEDIRAIAAEVVKELKPILMGNKNPSGNETIFNTQELAEYLKVSEQWIYERVRFKEIPHIKVGKFLKFRKSEIDKWLDNFKVIAVSSPPKLP